MNFKTIFIWGIVLLLLQSCSVFYKKPPEYKDQNNKIDQLKKQNKKLTATNKKLQLQLDTLSGSPSTPMTSESEPPQPSRVIPAYLDSNIVYSSSFLESVLQLEGQVAMSLYYRGANFDILVIDDPHKLKLFWVNGKQRLGSFARLKELADKKYKKELIFAMNAGMYTPDRAPKGLYIENGEEFVPLDTLKKGFGNFYMQPNGVFLIQKDGQAKVLTTEDYRNLTQEVTYATQSGPMAVIEGKINSHFKEHSKNLNIRNGVGVDSAGRIILLISNQKINLYTFGSIFKDVFKCKNALYLDGAVSQMYLPAIGRKDPGAGFGPLLGIMSGLK